MDRNTKAMIPGRIQRKRTKGYKTPPNTCYCGRGSKWGNPYVVGANVTIYLNHNLLPCQITLKASIKMYEMWLDGKIKDKELDLTELLKYDYLSCWCPLTEKCHVDIIINKLKEYRTFKCNKCGAEYIIKGDYVGCCTMPATYRTSGICGGELIKIKN